MRLTRFTDNALRCLIYLGRHNESTPTVGEVAERMSMSEDHLTKVVQRLAHGGVVLTVRGRHGGVRLAMPPEEINLGRVVRDCEEGFPIVPCFADPASCPISSNCLLASICDEALAAFLGVMDRHHLSDLLRAAVPVVAPTPPGRAPG